MDLFQNSLDLAPGVLEEVQTALKDFPRVFKMDFWDFQRSLMTFQAFLSPNSP